MIRQALKKVPLAVHMYRFINAIWREPLNQGKKTHLSWHFLKWYLWQKPRQQRTLARLSNGMKSWVYPDSDAGVSHIFTHNVDFHENQFIRKFLKPGDFIVDAGCNIGNRTLVMADVIQGALLIDANPICLERLKENYTLNGLELENYHLMCKAVGAEKGSVTFSDVGGSSCQNHIVSDSEAMGLSTRTVEMVTLDHALSQIPHPPCRFIKLDLEGHDLQGLKGAINTLKSGDVALVEFERWKNVSLAPFQSFFEALGWHLIALDAQGNIKEDEPSLLGARNLFALSPQAYQKLDLGAHQ